MTEVFKNKITRYLGAPGYIPRKLSALARDIGVNEDQYHDFKSECKQLQRDGLIMISTGNIITLPPMQNIVKGTFRANARGFGFVIPLQPNEHGDLFISPDATADAMNGDTVMAKVVKKGVRSGRMKYNGIIVEILQRGHQSIVGTLQQTPKQWLVQPDGKGFFEPIAIDDVKVKNAKADDKVVVDIIDYPTKSRIGRGVIVDVLGKAGAYESEIKAIITQYQLSGPFPTQCLDQARQAAENFNHDQLEAREDITEQVIITIDPPDAKDFDDAISLRKNKDGHWVLGVHIADVSTFIPMDSALDTEARARGNSVYLPAKVIPMLPEILSNGICSLQPNQKRFAKTAYITYDTKGNVLASEFANSLICSTARLTYQEADNILNGKAADFPSHVVALLKDMDDLARAIEKRRAKNGMLHLDLPETELILDDSGKVIDAKPADDSYPHTIIEMFMVEANDAVASLLDRFNTPFMRRIHPEPSPASAKNLSRFVKICGLKIPRKLDRQAIRDLLDAAKGKSYSYAINTHVLRSLQRAEYSPMHIGHFALASTHYCHFTSPIRRYADLMIHRLLDCYLKGNLNMIGLEEVLPDAELAEIGKHITYTEQQADSAEKELKTVLVLEMLSEHIGMELDCVVSGLTNFGVFVHCQRFGIDGLIEPGDLGMDEWKYDEKKQAVVGLHSGKSIHLGHPMKVKIASISVQARSLYLAPVEPLVNTRKSQKKPKKYKRRKNSRKHRQSARK